MLTTPAIANEITIAGPAWFFASMPVSVKMPVPITMPIPKPVRSRAVSRLLSPASAPSALDVVLVEDGVDVLGPQDRTQQAHAAPPATAGITEIWVPSGVGVSRFSRNRTSSLPT